MTKSRATRSANLNRRGANFDLESTMGLLRDVLGDQITMPPTGVLRIFAAQMNMIRKNVEISNVLFRESHALALAAQNALPVVILSLQRRRESVAGAVDLLGKAADEMACEPDSVDKTKIEQEYVRYREALKAGDRALTDLARISAGDEWFVRVDANPKFGDNWSDHLPKIIEVSRDLALSLGLGVGRSRGRYSKLLAALVYRTTGQEVSQDAIYDHLP